MILKIQDKEFILKYDINALALLEDITGTAISNILNENIGIKLLRNLFYVGLKRNHKDITVEDAGDMIQNYVDEHKDITKLQEIITKAFAESNLMNDEAKKK